MRDQARPGLADILHAKIQHVVAVVLVTGIVPANALTLHTELHETQQPVLDPDRPSTANRAWIPFGARQARRKAGLP